MSRREGPRVPAVARFMVATAAWLVPRERRSEWRAEWEAELEILVREAGTGESPDSRPSPARFALGAPVHALWILGTTLANGWSLDGLTHDLRFALRTLIRSPGFALVAAGTLALGIGANATIFALVDRLVFADPPGIERPDELVQVARSYDDEPRWDNWSWPAFEAIGRSEAFDGVAGYAGTAVVVGTGPEAAIEPALMVSGRFFEVLGVRSAVGRLLRESDDVHSMGHPVAVLGHAWWQTRFGGDPGVVGSTLTLGGTPYTVVGVAGPEFRGPEPVGPPPALYIPTAQREPSFGLDPRDQWEWSWLEVVGRRAPGVSLEALAPAMEVVTARLREATDANGDIRVLVAPGIGLSPADRAEARTLSLMLAGIAGLVLLLTCANVANLFIARATTRTDEMGVRVALGAGTARLARQLGTEAVVLGAGAALLAIPLLAVGVRLLPSLLPFTLAAPPGVDGRILLGLGGLGVTAGLLFGALPSVALARRDLAATLRENAATDRGARTTVRDALVVGQLAVSIALVAATGLLGRSVMKAAAADPGFDPRGLLAVGFDVERTGRYDQEDALDLFHRLEGRASELPGVRSATVASQAPFLGAYSRSGAWPESTTWEEGPSVEAETLFVGADYTRTMEMRLLEGRDLGASSEEPEPVALVSRSLARRFWPGESAVGKGLATGDGRVVRVVGVVDDVQHRSVRASAQPAVYRPLADAFGSRAVLLARVEGAPLAHADAVRGILAELDPGVPVTRVADVRGRMAATVGTTRTLGVLAGLFALLALVLSAVGLYGLVAYGVARRRRELGIRLALGSDPGRLIRLVLGGALRLALVGAGVGVGLALLAGRALEEALFRVPPHDPLLIAGAAGLLVAVAALAAGVPAWRASRTHAAVSLREG